MFFSMQLTYFFFIVSRETEIGLKVVLKIFCEIAHQVSPCKCVFVNGPLDETFSKINYVKKEKLDLKITNPSLKN